MKKTAVVILVAMLLTLLVSCGNDKTGITEISGENETEILTESETKQSIINLENADLPNRDYEGYKINIIEPQPVLENTPWWYMDFNEVNGEPINDAIYQRNKKIEDVFNVEIEDILTKSLKSDVPKSIKSDDNAFDIIFGSGFDSLFFAQNGNLVNLYSASYMDLDREWWDQNLKRDLTINGKLYFETGDISPVMDVRTFSLVFNKDLCKTLGLEYPYQYVLDGTWTVDLFSDYVKNVNRDMNGDGIMDYEDLWGFFSENGNSYMMYISAGGRLVNFDGEEIPKIVMDNEKNINIMTKALSITIDKTTTLKANEYVDARGGNWTLASQWFTSGNALIRSTAFESIPRDLRAMDTDFGVLPYPKFDETQDEYCSLPSMNSGFVVSIPMNADVERSSIILEALAAESVSTLSPAFYKVCLNGKVVRDVESEAMLDIIFGNKIYDLGYMLDIGGFVGAVTNMESIGSTDITSMYASIMSKSQATIDKLVESFKKLN